MFDNFDAKRAHQLAFRSDHRPKTWNDVSRNAGQRMITWCAVASDHETFLLRTAKDKVDFLMNGMVYRDTLAALAFGAAVLAVTRPRKQFSDDELADDSGKALAGKIERCRRKAILCGHAIAFISGIEKQERLKNLPQEELVGNMRYQAETSHDAELDGLEKALKDYSREVGTPPPADAIVTALGTNGFIATPKSCGLLHKVFRFLGPNPV